jgi:serpin B
MEVDEMKKVLLSILALILLFSLTSCAQPAAGEILQSKKTQVTSPEVKDSDLQKLVEGKSDFAFNLYQEIRKRNDNLFCSPYSISLALALTYAGARGETERQMAGTLHFTLPQETLHSAFNSLGIELGKRGEGAKGKDSKGFRLNIVNAIWGQKDYQFLPTFLDVLAENYGAGLRILDFASEPENSRLTINNWVSDQTEDRIKDLIPQGEIDIFTRLVLTNAIYFNAAWQYPFNKDATSDGTFFLLDNREVIVPMMNQTESFGYAENDKYQAVELPYDGGELSMVILLPKSGQFEAFEEYLDAEKVNKIINTLQNRQVALSMPKFEFETSFKLKDALTNMGMPIAFSDSADFSGMTGKRDLFISEVIHKAFVSVDEEGTEAAAATAVIMKLTAFPGEPVEVKVNRPFIFIIRDIETGTLLFLGRIINPGI